MSFETVFDVLAKFWLASPTVFAIDFASSFGLPSARGSGMPSTFGRLRRLLISSPPATPAAAAPTATAGPLALPAACLAVPATWLTRPPTWLTRSLTLALPFCEAAVDLERDVGFERDDDFERERDGGFELERDAGLEFVAFDRAVGLDCVVAFARVLGFERDDAFAERLEVLLAFGAEPFDDLLLDLLRGLLEAGLLFAILIPLLGSGTRLPRTGYPLLAGLTHRVAFLAAISNPRRKR
jgi:hypothetical protein